MSKSVLEVSGDLSVQEQAQQLALRALELPQSAERKRLVQEALALDPRCVDALCAEAAVAGSLDEASRKVKELAVQMERELGEAFFRENEGRLWEMPQARPYLRTRLCLADLLARAGRFRMAQPHLQALLRMCPSYDPLKVRYPLARCFACQGRIKELKALLNQFQTDISPVWTWMGLLECIKSQRLEDARLYLRRARERNVHIEGYLTGTQLPPREVSGEILPGSSEEAAYALRFLELAWRSDRQAMYWLFRGAYE